jgi:hypothetical protein
MTNLLSFRIRLSRQVLVTFGLSGPLPASPCAQLLHGNHRQRLGIRNLELATLRKTQKCAKRPLNDFFDERLASMRRDSTKSSVGLLANLWKHVCESGTK